MLAVHTLLVVEWKVNLLSVLEEVTSGRKERTETPKRPTKQQQQRQQKKNTKKSTKTHKKGKKNQPTKQHCKTETSTKTTPILQQIGMSFY